MPTTAQDNMESAQKNEDTNVELAYEDPKATSTSEDNSSEPSSPSDVVPAIDLDENAEQVNNSRSRRRSLAVGCATCLLIVGIVLLVLGLQGYFTFQEPCVGMKYMTIEDRSFVYNDESSDSDSVSNESHPLLALVEAMTGIAGSSAFVPKQVNLTLNLIVQVNNTNPYDLNFHQRQEGTIAIPAFATKPTTGDEDDEDDDDDDFLNNILPEEDPDDLTVGTWQVPGSTLKKRAENEIPVTIVAEIDLLKNDDIGLTTIFLKGGDLMFRIKGGFGGSSWVPGLSGRTDMVCFAKVQQDKKTRNSDDNKEARVKCTKSTKIGSGGLINGRRGLHGGSTTFLGQADEVDPRCLV